MSRKNVIKSRYNDLGGRGYDMRYTEEQIAKYRLILEELPASRLVLDNGCGTGLLFPFIGTSLVGLDLSSGLLEEALTRRGSYTYLVQGDSENLPFRASVFDAVVSVTVIQNLSEPEKMAHESSRVSKPGSTVVISSHKRVYKDKTALGKLLTKSLLVSRVFTDENINDWIAVAINGEK